MRQEIARESNALRAVPQADTEGMAVTLIGLAESATGLPLRRSVPEHYVPGGATGAASAQPEQSLWQKFKAGAVRLLSTTCSPCGAAASPWSPCSRPREELFLRLNLELQAGHRPGGTPGPEGPAFHDSVHSARIWLESYFDTHDKAVRRGGAAAHQHGSSNRSRPSCRTSPLP